VRHWVVLKAIFVKTLIETRRYIFNTISGLITMYIIFLLLFYGAKTVGGSTFQTGDSLEGLVVGYMVWMLALLAYQDLAWGISMEAEIGTLEQLYLSPAGFSWVNASWLIVRSVVSLVFLGLILLVMMLTTGQWLNLDLVSLVPLILLTMLAPYGFGFMTAGLALVFKRIQAAFQILQFVFVAFVAVPITQFAWVKFLPLAMGNHLLRQVMVDGTRLWGLPAGELGLAAAVGVGYFLLGLGAFSYCVNAARDRGLMGQY